MELKHAILGLLSVRPMSGYDLGRAFGSSVVHFWYADQSQIYRTLARLTEGALVSTEVIHQDGKPDRKVHSLTASGEAELRRWLASPLEDEQSKEPFLARLFFAAPLGRDAVLALLAERERQTGSLSDTLAAVDASGDDLAAVLRRATLENGLAHAQAELAWIRATRRQLDEGATS